MSFARIRLALCLTALAILGALALAGCNGGGTSTGNSLRPYIGRWTGAFVATPVGSNQQENGTADIVVATSGTVTGTLHNTTTGDTGTITGLLTVDNRVAYINGSITYGATAAYQVAGTLSIAANNHLTGSINSYDTQRHIVSSATVDLVLQ